MKRIAILVLSAGLLIGGVATVADSHEAHKHGAEKKAAAPDKAKAGDTEAIHVGEILDMACYMPNQEKGPKHADCAKACVKGGAPAGLLLKDGRVLLLIADHSNEKAFDGVKALAGEMAAIKGKMIERGGMKALMVKSAEKAK